MTQTVLRGKHTRATLSRVVVFGLFFRYSLRSPFAIHEDTKSGSRAPSLNTIPWSCRTFGWFKPFQTVNSRTKRCERSDSTKIADIRYKYLIHLCSLRAPGRDWLGLYDFDSYLATFGVTLLVEELGAEFANFTCFPTIYPATLPNVSKSSMGTWMGSNPLH
jgi:hypothetical protein